ncbi:MAG: RpiB/LacA/LacB family sugar-phosphate isomerase [Candidatus Magasanikbacteria bacterium]|nr:RpiB/LacA/LacB family sugar-phosphate isomerase [Candidatus Magasanikbacteria bacterium]
MSKPTIYIGSDYMGFELKEKLKTYIKNKLKKKVEDLGPKKRIDGDDAIDYAVKVSRAVVKDDNHRGILICHSGHGMCITANKITGTRASIGYSVAGAEMLRLHDNGNILCLAASALNLAKASAIVKKFLQTDFKPITRRLRRLKKLNKLDSRICK